jgi:hypothetical protein
VEADERRALSSFRASLLAFADEPSVVNLERYLAASRRLDAVRAKKRPERRAA